MSVIHDTLRYVGVGPQYRGYRYLAQAVELVMEYGGNDIQITKTVYPEIAEKNNTAWRSVERDIRTAIQRAWEADEQEVMRKIFGHHLKHRPTNMQFICRMAEELRKASAGSGVGTLYVQFMAEN